MNNINILCIVQTTGVSKEPHIWLLCMNFLLRVTVPAQFSVNNNKGCQLKPSNTVRGNLHPTVMILLALRRPTRLPFYQLLPREKQPPQPLSSMSSGLPSQTQSLLETTFKWRHICLAVSLYSHKIVCCICLLVCSTPLPPPTLRFNIAILSKQVSWVSKSIHFDCQRAICRNIPRDIAVRQSSLLFVLGWPSWILQRSWMLSSQSCLNLTPCSYLNNNSDCIIC